ncbi:hypothetical protein AKJ16_DCAP21110 [Drosera capensis]
MQAGSFSIRNGTIHRLSEGGSARTTPYQCKNHRRAASGAGSLAPHHRGPSPTKRDVCPCLLTIHKEPDPIQLGPSIRVPVRNHSPSPFTLYCRSLFGYASYNYIGTHCSFDKSKANALALISGEEPLAVRKPQVGMKSSIVNRCMDSEGFGWLKRPSHLA